jgi:hypothetical protein
MLVRLTFRVVLGRADAETLAAWSIREEKNLVTLVIEVLEAVPTKTRGRD